MLRRSLLLLVAALILALPAPSVGTASSAAARRHAVTLWDGHGDVHACFDGCTLRRVPTADIVGFRAVHGRFNLRFLLRFKDLRRTAGVEDFWVYIKTDRLERLALVETWTGHWQGSHYMDNAEGDTESARGMVHRVRYGRNTVTLVVPRALVGRPQWVRVGEDNEIYPPDLPDGWMYVDNAQTHEPGYDALSPRLYRS